MQENSQIQVDQIEKDQLQSKINKYEHEIIQLKEKNQIISSTLKELSEQNQAEELRNSILELEKKNLQTIQQARDEEFNRLKEQHKTQSLELEYFQNILYQHAQTQLEKEQIVESQKKHYKDIFKKYVDLDIESENIRKENLLLKNEQSLLEQRVQSFQKQCRDIQEIYSLRLSEFQDQFNSMNTTITILQKQVDENKYFKDFMQSQIQLNQDIESSIEDAPPSNITAANPITKMIPEEEEDNNLDQGSQNYLLEENFMLNQQVIDYETKMAPRILQKEQEIKTLQDQLQDLQRRNDEISKENSFTLKELQEIKYKQNKMKENAELENMPISQFTEKDILLLQRAYLEEKTIRLNIQQTLKEVQDEIKRKNPIIRKQNEKWLKLNQEFLKFEQEYGQQQKEMKLKLQTIEELKGELKDSLNENVKLQSQTHFLTEEISRLATQIQHLLKVNMKLKQNISAKLGKNQLDEIIEQIRKEKNQQLSIQDVDAVYQTNYQSLYSDIQEIVEMNMDLCKKLRDRS